jgi:quercetin dioxygenase-like cupin family protein
VRPRPAKRSAGEKKWRSQAGDWVLSGVLNGLKSGTVLKRTELKGAPGWEAILVQREVLPGAESGKHTQGGNEIVYIQEGSVTLEVQGKPAVNLKASEAFTTSARVTHP